MPKTLDFGLNHYWIWLVTITTMDGATGTHAYISSGLNAGEHEVRRHLDDIFKSQGFQQGHGSAAHRVIKFTLEYVAPLAETSFC